MKLSLLSKKQETPDTWTLRFKPEKVFSYKPGQYLLFDVEVEKGGVMKKERRAFSISSPINKKGTIEITVKKYPDGTVSPVLCGLEVGEEVEAIGPFGKFTHEPGENKLVLLGAGTGIAPLRAIIYEALKSKQDVILIYSAKREAEIIYKEELEALKGKARIVFTLTREEKKGFEKGRISQALLKKFVGDFEKPLFYLCGPLSFVRDMEALLSSLGAKKIKKEIFD